uniref:Uncharacterized protein n=1 Tax=Hucho hucho TaxID=62062 RepID=A0A4W5MWV1_9TELE
MVGHKAVRCYFNRLQSWWVSLSGWHHSWGACCRPIEICLLHITFANCLIRLPYNCGIFIEMVCISFTKLYLLYCQFCGKWLKQLGKLLMCIIIMKYLIVSPLPTHKTNSTAPQRVPVASPSAHNIGSSTTTDRSNFPRNVTSRSTFSAGQQRAARDQHASTYNGPPSSPSLSYGNSQARRAGGTGIFRKFTSKFVRRNLTFRFPRR